ncbi:MAG TPA: SpoIIE family protein phosphatase [Verrucomicrobiae bacterium]
MGQPLRVLLIEDSDFDATLLVRMLGKGGYDLKYERVETAQQLETALQGEWDLVIADYNLPQFSAPEALEMVKKTGRDIPFVIVSGAIGETTAVAAMKAGAHDYLMKGNLARLLPVIDRELREAQNREGKRQTKEALLESESRYRLLWETATDAVILFDREGRITFANPAVEELFDYKPSELIGKEVFLLQPATQHWAQQGGLKRYLKSSAPGRSWRARETLGLKKDGTEFPVEAAFSNIQIDQTVSFVVFFRDITERKRAEKELQQNQEQFRVAREIQQHLFPKSAPIFAGLDIAGRTFPADATGGDYFDFLPMAENCVGLVVGDVTGHGVGPALLMAETRAYLRVLARTKSDAGIILSEANRVLAEDLGSERFVTLFLARLNAKLHRLAYVNAGHIPAYVFDPSGEVALTLKRTGIPLGLREETAYHESAEIDLAPGQIFLALTDGFEEAVNAEEEMFGVERVLEVIKENRTRSANEIIQALYDAVQRFSGSSPQLDDLTAVIIKVV